jgi:hypothetical protein
MPRKRRVNKAKEQLTDTEWNYLTDQPLPADFETFALEIDFKGNMEQLWHLHRDVILAEHVKDHPGTRPALWWSYDAPRLPVGTFPGWYDDGKLPEPRKRLAGKAKPVIGVPSYYGIPAHADVDNVFESQAAYLKRHELLITGEEKRCDFEAETTL